MKIINIFSAVSLILICFNSNASGSSDKDLREYFFYTCVHDGLKDIGISKVDSSREYSVSVLTGDYSEIKQVAGFAKDYASKIPISKHGGKKGILSMCLEAYESNMLNKFIYEE